MARRPRRPHRVFIGLTEIASYYGYLAEGFRSHGIQVTFADLSDDPFHFGGSSSDQIVRLARRAASWRTKAAPQGGLGSVASKIAYRTALLVLFASAVARHDTFVFGFGSSFFWLRELRFLRRIGKTIVFVFNGSDARPPYIDGALMDPILGRTVDACIEMSAKKKREITEIERWSNLVVSHALHLHFFERPTAGFLVLGVPGPGPEGPEPEPHAPPIRILHSPSHRGVKGSDRVRSAVERLKAQGMQLELVELHGVPNHVVHQELRKCHFVVDQLYSDGPMLTFSREAALYSRPAIVGSYGWEEIRRLMPSGAIAPVEACHPDELEAAIRKLATDAEYRRKLGSAAREFTRGWTSHLVARRYLRLLRGERPAAWMCDPSEVRYVHGVGLSDSRARDIVSRVIRRGGVAALQIGDKPALEEAFLSFARPSHQSTQSDQGLEAPAEGAGEDASRR